MSYSKSEGQYPNKQLVLIDWIAGCVVTQQVCWEGGMLRDDLCNILRGDYCLCDCQFRHKYKHFLLCLFINRKFTSHKFEVSFEELKHIASSFTDKFVVSRCAFSKLQKSNFLESAKILEKSSLCLSSFSLRTAEMRNLTTDKSKCNFLSHLQVLT